MTNEELANIAKRIERIEDDLAPVNFNSFVAKNVAIDIRQNLDVVIHRLDSLIGQATRQGDI